MTRPFGFTIVQDTQEKLPLLFPKTLTILPPDLKPRPSSARTVAIELVKERLDDFHPECKNADYYVRGHPGKVVLERKKDINEIAQNVLNPRRRSRFIRELKYLHDTCCRPILLAEGTPQSLLIKSAYCEYPEVACDALLSLLLKYRIELWMMPATTVAHRRAMGEFAARIMIQGALQL